MEPVTKTCIAPVNIALVKYWGKSNEELIVPLNDSISVTLDCGRMYTKTTATASPDLTEDTITINNEESLSDNVRFRKCIEAVRLLASHSTDPEVLKRSQWKVCITSDNSFPTKAGLASSASGYACLVFTLAHVFGMDTTSSMSELSALARRGSGSACRSLFGGFVHWKKEGLCVAEQIAPANHWPELRCIVAVVSSASKSVGSTDGMRRSVETSSFLQHRVNNVLPQRIEQMRQAILDKDFDKLALATMQDSNQFHAVCLDTYPPIFYLNETSQSIIRLVHLYNQHYGKVKVAYTFDAGPNAVLITQDSDSCALANILQQLLSTCTEADFFRGISPTIAADGIDRSLIEHLLKQKLRGSVEYVITCRLGKGPVLVE